MVSISISLDGSNKDSSVLVLQLCRLSDGLSTSGDGLVENTCGILYFENDILDTISVKGMMRFKLILSLWLIC